MQAALTIYYNQGAQKYELEQSLQPEEQMWIDVGKLIREHVPDKNGNVLPADLASGSYELRDLTNKGIGNLFEGKVVYDKTYGHVTYGCGGCCGYNAPYHWYNPLGVPLAAQAGNGVDAYDTCGSYVDDLSSLYWGTWTTANQSIATVDYYANHTGVAVGATTSAAHASIQRNLRPSCPVNPTAPTGSDNVAKVRILLGGSTGTDITNTTTAAVVGQQISLYANYLLPSTATLTSLLWTTPGASSNPPTAISNFVNSSTGGPVALSSGQLGSQTITFYWVVPASSNVVTLTINYNINGVAQPAATASATFNVFGPTSVQMAYVAGGKPQFLNNGTTSVTLEFGDPTATPGIEWSGSATSPTQAAGTYRWAQIISNNSYSYTVGTTTTTCAGPTGLDNQLPLAITTGTFTDSPDRSLPSTDNKFTWSWDATTSFMWNSGSTNSIWVPIAQREWKFYADVAQNLSTKVWTVQTDSSSFVGAPQIGYFPIQWNKVAPNGSLGGCQ